MATSRFTLINDVGVLKGAVSVLTSDRQLEGEDSVKALDLAASPISAEIESKCC